MEMGEKWIMVEHVGKEVIVDSENQICRWVHIVEML